MLWSVVRRVLRPKLEALYRKVKVKVKARHCLFRRSMDLPQIESPPNVDLGPLFPGVFAAVVGVSSLMELLCPVWPLFLPGTWSKGLLVQEKPLFFAVFIVILMLESVLNASERF